MPDVEKTVNIKLTVDDAEVAKIDAAEGKVKDMVDNLKGLKGGTFDIKPGGGGATPSGKTPDRDPSFQMLRIINLTLNKILNQMRGEYIGAKRQTATGTTGPSETGTSANKNRDLYEKNKDVYDENRRQKIPIPKRRASVAERTASEIAEEIGKRHYSKPNPRDYLKDVMNEDLKAKYKRQQSYFDALGKEGAKRKQKDTIDWFDGVKEAAKPTFSVEDITSRSYVDSPWNPQVNNKKRSIEIDAANDWRKGIRGMITGALIDFHVLRIVANQSKVLASYMDIVGKSFGLLVDMILLPLMPVAVILSKALLTVALYFNQLAPAIKTAISAFVAFGTALFLYGAFKGGMTGGIFGALKGGIGTVRGGFSKILGRASGGPLAFGQTAIVGENGPEMLLPTSGGFHVVPNNQLRMLADGTLGSAMGYGLGGVAIGGMLGGKTGAAVGGIVGAGVGASGLGGYLPGAIGGAAQAFYSNPGVQGTIVALSSIASSINAVLAPIAPILGIVGGVISAAHMTGGKAAEATTRVGTVLNKTMQSVGFAVQNVVARSAQSTNLILTMILMKIPELLAGLGLPPIPTGSKTPPKGKPDRTPGPEPRKPPEPEKGKLPPEPERGRLPPEPNRGKLPPAPERGKIPPPEERGKLPFEKRVELRPLDWRERLPEGMGPKALPEGKTFKSIFSGTDSGMFTPGKFLETIGKFSFGKNYVPANLAKMPKGEDFFLTSGMYSDYMARMMVEMGTMNKEDTEKWKQDVASPIDFIFDSAIAAIQGDYKKAQTELTKIPGSIGFGEYRLGTKPSEIQKTEDNRNIYINIYTKAENAQQMADEVAKIFKQNASRTGMI